MYDEWRNYEKDFADSNPPKTINIKQNKRISLAKNSDELFLMFTNFCLPTLICLISKNVKLKTFFASQTKHF